MENEGERIEEEFNDEESRIPFSQENMFNEKSVMSIQFDLEQNNVVTNSANQKRHMRQSP